jgi:hypothetical protein
MPDPPTPAIALPTIRASIVGAAPQTAEPISKSMMLAMNRNLRSKLE